MAHAFLRSLCALAALAPAPLAANWQSANVVVAIDNVRSSQGRVLVTLCPRAAYPGPCIIAGDGPAVKGTTLVIVHGVPPGSYAAMAFHDANGNRRLDTLLRVPREGYGFSMLAHRAFGPPSFDAASFEHGTQEQRVPVRLTYLW